MDNSVSDLACAAINLYFTRKYGLPPDIIKTYTKVDPNDFGIRLCFDILGHEIKSPCSLEMVDDIKMMCGVDMMAEILHGAIIEIENNAEQIPELKRKLDEYKFKIAAGLPAKGDDWCDDFERMKDVVKFERALE